jgi:transcriptional regulator with XRE-family HTH domain
VAAERQRQRLSQHRLADLAGVSQRHISFLETGRAQPGRQSLGKLIAALCVAPPQAVQWFVAAGLTAPRQPLDWTSAQVTPVRSAARLLLDTYDPYPAVVVNRAGDVLDSNRGFSAIVEFVDRRIPPPGIWTATCGPNPRNMYDLVLHPAGLLGMCANASTVAAHTVYRLRRAAALDPGAATTLARVRHYPTVLAATLPLGTITEHEAHGVLIETYDLPPDPTNTSPSQRINIISTTTSFGSPEDAIAQDVQIEVYLPADDRTQRTMRTIARQNIQRTEDQHPTPRSAKRTARRSQ